MRLRFVLASKDAKTFPTCRHIGRCLLNAMQPWNWLLLRSHKAQRFIFEGSHTKRVRIDDGLCQSADVCLERACHVCSCSTASGLRHYPARVCLKAEEAIVFADSLTLNFETRDQRRNWFDFLVWCVTHNAT
jgi:hypothetical protein